MDYLSVSEFAAAKGKSRIRVYQVLQHAGRIAGAEQVDGHWRIPASTEWPEKRTPGVKARIKKEA